MNASFNEQRQNRGSRRTHDSDEDDSNAASTEKTDSSDSRSESGSEFSASVSESSDSQFNRKELLKRKGFERFMLHLRLPTRSTVTGCR